MPNEITNINLLYLRKARGVASLSRYAAGSDGSLVAAVPDEMEVRTFHVVRFDAQGRSNIRETFNVETLRKTEVVPVGPGHVGITDDDLYIFRETKKTRLLADRRATFSDIALAETGQRFAAAYSDLLASGWALAYGDTSGRLLWTKDIPFAVSRVAVDRAGNHIAVAGEQGELLLLDHTRAIRGRFYHGSPLTAVATAGPGKTFFAGGGGVGALDDEGRLAWFTELGANALALAMDATGSCIAVLVKLDETAGRLYFLSRDGLPIWDVDFDDARPTGLSLSADGRFAGVTLRDGSLYAYELQYGERLAAVDAEQVLAEAQAALTSGNLHAAVEMLRGRLAAVPSDAQACEALVTVLGEFRERAVRAAENAEAVGDHATADARLAEYLAADPLDAETIIRRRDLRHRWAIAAHAAGKEALDLGDASTAEVRFLEAVAADPLDPVARLALGAARHAAASAALLRGQARLKRAEFPEAIVAFTEAQARGASGPEVTALLRAARIGEALALGNALYRDRQYPAALFQFKKVLRLDPENREAVQKAGYARQFLQDTQLVERFSRLE